jgi:hypothetical protein
MPHKTQEKLGAELPPITGRLEAAETTRVICGKSLNFQAEFKRLAELTGWMMIRASARHVFSRPARSESFADRAG